MPCAHPMPHAQDTNAMREMVQKLCQSSHPLAKSMDYLQACGEKMWLGLGGDVKGG